MLEAKERFQKNLEEHFHTTAKKERASIHNQAWDRFLQLGLPTKEMEVYRCIKLRSLYQQSFALAEPATCTLQDLTPYFLPECKGAVLVFVNGFFHPTLSQTAAIPDRIVISSFQEAQRTYGTFIHHHLTTSLKEESDPLTAANAALNDGGAFLYLPPKSVVTTPIQLLFVVNAETAIHLFPRLTVFCGAHSQLSLVSTQAVLAGTRYCLNQCTDMIIEEGAHAALYQIHDENPPEAWHFDAFRATLKQHSTCKVFAMTNGCAAMRSDYRVVLKGENADVQLHGIWMLQKKREAHTNVLVDHQAPRCHSMQTYKGVLNDSGRSSFEGKIFVGKLAQHTDAFQLNRNLLLSGRASAHSKPNLEIFADDVKASHGATVGPPDDEQLFYLKTRGCTSSDAKKILVQGFCQEVIDHIPSLSMKGFIAQKIKKHAIHGLD